MRFIIRPLRDPETAIDLTDAVVDAIAERLSLACGGNAVLNRLEAAAHLDSVLRRAAAGVPTRGRPTDHHQDAIFEEEVHAGIDSSDGDRERQPEGFVVRRIALERAG